jgi:hypothetical protein
MSEINHLKFLYYVRLYGGYLIVDVNHLYVKIIHLVSFIYIVIEDLYYIHF